MLILSIDTSCDDTSVAITEKRQVIAKVQFSQIKVHAPFGGVYPSLAKREHLTKIDPAIFLALKRAKLTFKEIEAIAVTYGPGLPPALEVGVQKAIVLAKKYHKPLIPVDHLEGHIYSSFAQNQQGKPTHEFKFPTLAFIISGGHTQLVLLKEHLNYQIFGETLDDAAGEALDKAARLLGLGYPGGPIIEKLAKQGGPTKYILPIPMQQFKDLRFSFSGLKTAFKRLVYKLTEKEKLSNLADLCASYQNAIFTALLGKLKLALKIYSVKQVVFGGGVTDNKELRKRARKIIKPFKIPIYFPPYKYLSTDNAAMIGVVAYYKYQKGIIINNPDKLDRIPRSNLDNYLK